MSCKYCGSVAVVKCGSYKGVQNYLCKACRRKFKTDNHLFHMSVPPVIISTTLNMFYSGDCINDIRNYLNQKYSYYPSASLLYLWIKKYTERANAIFSHYLPEVSDMWIAYETTMVKGQRIYFVYDIMDENTLFLLASVIDNIRNPQSIIEVMSKAIAKAAKSPKEILLRMPYCYSRWISDHFDCETEHVRRDPFTLNREVDLIKDIRRTRGKMVQYLRTQKTINEFFTGFLINYNYFKTQVIMENKSPAEATGIKYYYHSWEDIIDV
jgi:transposase-like protein